MVAYAANEVGDDGRASLLAELLGAHSRGAAVLVIEPIARRAAPWWPQWETRIVSAGGRADEWRFPSTLPPRQQALARAAGLDPRELTARSLYLPAPAALNGARPTRAPAVFQVESPRCRRAAGGRRTELDGTRAAGECAA